MLRKWVSSTSPTKASAVSAPNCSHMFDPEIMRLEEAAHQTRMELQRLRKRGKQVRLRRLQALDAMEMRRMALTEVLNRMTNELNEKDVHEYADALVAVSGKRKAQKNRAVEFETKLCRSMHQMMAKQNQLKIMKVSAKSIQQFLMKQKQKFRDEYFSFDALTIQIESSRMSLDTIYSEIFAAQLRTFSMLRDETDFIEKKLELSRTPITSDIIDPQCETSLVSKMNNCDIYDIVDTKDVESESAKDRLSVSMQAMSSQGTISVLAARRRDSFSSFADEKKDGAGDAESDNSSQLDGMSKRRDDYRSSSIVVGDDTLSLSHYSYSSNVKTKSLRSTFQAHTSDMTPLPPPSTISSTTNVILPPIPVPAYPVTEASSGDMSARERRRRIEKMRLASGSRGTMRAMAVARADSSNDIANDDSSSSSTRHRLRKLEELQHRKSLSQGSFSNKCTDPDAASKRATRSTIDVGTNHPSTPPRRTSKTSQQIAIVNTPETIHSSSSSEGNENEAASIQDLKVP